MPPKELNSQVKGQRKSRLKPIFPLSFLCWRKIEIIQKKEGDSMIIAYSTRNFHSE